LRQKILSGHYARGGKFYSNSSLAREFNISSITAGMIISRLEEENLVKRVPRSGTYVSFSMDAEVAGGQIAENSSFVIITSMDTEFSEDRDFYYDIISGFELSLAKYKCHSRIVNVQQFDEQAIQVLEDIILEDSPLGIFINHLDNAKILGKVRKVLQGYRVPVVFWNGDVPGLGIGDEVVFDNLGIGMSAARHLHELGHRNMAYFSSPGKWEWSRQRYEGFSQVIKELTGKTSNFIADSEKIDSEFRAVLTEALGLGVTAIFAENDKMAKAIYSESGGLGVKIPENLSLIGVDDLPYTKKLELTTFSLAKKSLGNVAFEMLLERIKKPELPKQNRKVECPMIPRHSTAMLNINR
jgi:DNA-binding LacI/PurR family transcriptional regulator